MSRAEEKNRLFSGSDADMLQASRVMQGIFVEDLTSFTAFDNSFAEPFADNWLAKIDECSAIVWDSSYVDTQAALTQKVEDKMEECRVFVATMKYFVEKAFPDQREIQSRFGFDDYEKARRSQTKMIQFLGILSKTAGEYSAQLTAAGFTQEKIDQISTLQTGLTNADYEQELSKKKRPLVTQERIRSLNECYEFLQKVSKAGKLIFAADYAKYQQYLLPIERQSKAKEDETAPEGEPV